MQRLPDSEIGVLVEFNPTRLLSVTDFPKAPTIALDSTLTSICSAYALTLRQRLIDDGHFILS